MSSHEHFEGDTKKFTLTAFLSFATVFCVLMLFMRCHGSYKPNSAAHHEEVKAEQHETGAHKETVAPDSTHPAEHKDTTKATEAHH
jgi:hypothetical protein